MSEILNINQFEDQLQVIKSLIFLASKSLYQGFFHEEYLFAKVGSITNLRSSYKVGLALQNVLKNCHTYAYHLFLLELFPSHTGPLVTGICNGFASDILTTVMNDIVKKKKKKKQTLPLITALVAKLPQFLSPWELESWWS